MMSYSAQICFKTLEEGELYSFLQQFKALVNSSFDAIAKDNFLWLPSIRYEHRNDELPDYTRFELDKYWAQTSVFTHRYFYLPEHKLLGMFNVPDAAEKAFDLAVFFQNSTDQDYSFDRWKGIPIFEEIAQKWQTASEEEVKKRYSQPYGDEWDDECDFDYYRRDFAYADIWAMCEKYLYNESEVVYLSLFGNYESWLMSAFVNLCKKHYEEWLKENTDE